MARSIWTGAISFGLVTVPVKMYSAVSRKTVRFHQLHRKTGARIAMRRVDPSTGDEVPYEDIVKGFELSPERYVVIEPDELEALDPARTRTIEILDFVDLSEIDPIFYDHPYYLAPGPGGAKPYTLLLEAMRETNRVGIAKVVIRSKEQLVALRPMQGPSEGTWVLGLATMVFADEVLDPARIDDLPGETQVDDRELAIAKQLVESLAADFEPSKYSDEYRAQVLELIDRKAAGEEIAVAPAAPDVAAPVPDLMAALKASLEAARGGDSPRKRPAPRKPSGGKPAAGKAQARKKPAAGAKASS